MSKKEWLDWLKCNVLEIVVLVLVLVLLVKVYSVPVVEEVPATIEVVEPLAEEVSLESGELSEEAVKVAEPSLEEELTVETSTE